MSHSPLYPWFSSGTQLVLKETLMGAEMNEQMPEEEDESPSQSCPNLPVVDSYVSSTTPPLPLLPLEEEEGENILDFCPSGTFLSPFAHTQDPLPQGELFNQRVTHASFDK